jgi:hypothetical protein
MFAFVWGFTLPGVVVVVVAGCAVVGTTVIGSWQ